MTIQRAKMRNEEIIEGRGMPLKMRVRLARLGNEDAEATLSKTAECKFCLVKTKNGGPIK